MVLDFCEMIEDCTREGWGESTSLWDLLRRILQQRSETETVVDAFDRIDFAHGESQRLTRVHLAEAVDRSFHLLLELGRSETPVAAYKLPEYLLSMPMLPRNPVGKVLKTELRALAKARYATNEGDMA